jgi:HD-like signal output (HDOD) protein
MTGKALMNSKCIEAAIKGLPALPTVIIKLLEETERDDVSISEVERLISSDQELVSKILKIVNSSYYGMPGQVGTIGQAIVILGLRQVRNLVLGVHAMNAILPKDHKNPERLNLLWSESLGTAIGARIIGKHKGIGEVEIEHVYVGGLLRRIGKLFLYGYFEDKLNECELLTEKWGLDTIAAQEQILGLNQYTIGGMLADNWNLPAQLRSFLSFVEVPEDSLEVDSYRVIDAAAEYCRLDKNGEFAPVNSEQPSIVWAAFSDTEWDWVKREVQVRVESMNQLVGSTAA